MQSLEGRNGRSSDLRLALERLDGLPLRPVSARAILDLASETPDDPEIPGTSPARLRFLDHDPGVVMVRRRGDLVSLMETVARRSWWRTSSSEVRALLENLWKHAVAASLSARRLAVEAGRSDADDLAEAALLNQLGWWAVAAVEPEHLLAWMAIPHRSARREAERKTLGIEATALGARLARRWKLSPLILASAWLHADQGSDLSTLSDDPDALVILQKAFQWAERTPWARFPQVVADPGPGDPRLKILMAEVQVRCTAGLLDEDASPREEKLSRSHAVLWLRESRQSRVIASQERLLRAIVESDVQEDPHVWADRAARLWCEEPGVASAQVVWLPDRETPPRNDGSSDEASRKPCYAIPLGSGRPTSELRLWAQKLALEEEAPSSLLISAWGAWSDLIAHRESQSRDLNNVVATHRTRREVCHEEERTSRLEALAQFAAGAGHELNNPLAVILGRAQLLIPRMEEPDAVRSLRIIIGQAQRAHRILRDLMYVARPPQPRPRPCQPDEILRASLRDLKTEADARGVRLVGETLEPVPVAWTDPDPLRHLADVLVRNALESTPPGGTVRVTSGRDGESLRWTVRDTGRGITPEEGVHLFDPFYCGRQAGRGLGLGLSRIARFTSQAGGRLSWRSHPGEGTVFRVDLPLQGTGTRG